MNYCLICGNELKGCICPRCGFDLSQCVAYYPTLDAIKQNSICMHTTRDKLYRELEELRARKSMGKLPETQTVAVEIIRQQKKIPLAAGGMFSLGIEPTGDPAYHGRRNEPCGNPLAAGDNSDGQCDVYDWQDLVAVAAGWSHAVGLRQDGTVCAVGSNSRGQCEVEDWREIVAISAGPHFTAGLRANGRVVVAGDKDFDVSHWRNITAIAGGGLHLLGLRKDGNVAATGSNSYGQCEVGGWRNVTAISAGARHSVGLTETHELITAGSNQQGQRQVQTWKNLTACAAGGNLTIGLGQDGTVKTAGNLNSLTSYEINKVVSQWNHITYLCCSATHILGMRIDGKVLGLCGEDKGQCDVSWWRLLDVRQA